MTQLNNWIPFIYFLICGLNKLENTNTTVYRALDKPLSQLSKQYQLGKSICWVSFTSTSLDKTIMNSFISKNKKEGTFLQINVIEGKDISEFSLFPNEKELLLLPNSQFVVDEVISSQMKKMMSLPDSIDWIILSQKLTPIHLLLMKQNLEQSKQENLRKREEEISKREESLRKREQDFRNSEQRKLEELRKKRRRIPKERRGIT